MKKSIYSIILLAALPLMAYSQQLTQTVRGRLVDSDSKIPIIGATISIPDADPIVGTITDLDGYFRLENVPVGRITLQFSYLGYETKTLPNVVVNSGKEVVLNLDLQESAVAMEEVVVKAIKNKGRALDDMSIVSARSISVEESKRYAGGFDDPSRIVSNYAGVSTSPDGSSDIIVRGNSPKYMQWRLEGVEITSPYHFDDQNSSFGGLSAINNNLLTASDFYTGAFSPEHGNVLSNVFDVRFRPGNNEKLEATVGFGLIGTDVTLEGPIKKGYSGSFLANYRYSTASLIQDMGLIEMDGLFNFQDANLKIVLPTKRFGTFSIFGLGGLSNFSIEDLTPDVFTTQTNHSSVVSNIRQDYEKANYLLNTGINHTLSLGSRSFLRTSLTYSGSGITDDIFKSNLVQTYNDQGEFMSDSAVNRTPHFSNDLYKSTIRGAMTYNYKINAKHKIQIGTNYGIHKYDFKQSQLPAGQTDLFTVVDIDENIQTIQNFVSWKFRMNDKFTIVSGLHNMNVLFNKESTLEPRIALNWNLNKTNAINLGYGNHSTMESIHHYFAKVEQPDGSITEPNKDLSLLKAHHFVLGYEKRFSKNLMGKIEGYYQNLYDLPVENSDTSYFATINEGLDYRYVDLVNEGTGKNYGVEITLERFFDKNYYFLINASLFNSTYKSLEGIERNTRYNKNYLANVLVGKEFNGLGKKDNQTLALNFKMFFQGGQKIIPLLRDDNGDLAVEPENNTYWDYSKAFESKLDDIYQINFSVSYKWNRKKATHELFLDLQNLTNNTGRLYEYYDESEPGNIGYVKQFGFFPNLMYRVYF